ncbi:tautomerase family protein [Roseiterribacter gracilis]|uniref:Putative 4-oxalocrotonate tautomerase n=1 Tax=Roseiterribacter gracilis TaxID=2812848 RepID=A0A8S8XA98_9PROT|nr:putative 4-oxalocrotonate tautomerase [Rhodospirillales bacterium TMPK1]
MPLVRLTTGPSRDAASRRAIADAAHAVLIRTLVAPADDRFQLLETRDTTGFIADPAYLGMDRRDPVLIEVTCKRGRSDDQKRAFYAGLAAALEPVGVRGDDLIVVLTENDGVDWSFGRGVAQYAPGT